MKFGFIGRHGAEFPVTAMCRVSRAPRGGCCAWMLGRESATLSQERRTAVVVAASQATEQVPVPEGDRNEQW